MRAMKQPQNRAMDGLPSLLMSGWWRVFVGWMFGKARVLGGLDAGDKQKMFSRLQGL